MISITFPDGASRAFEPGVTGFDVAAMFVDALERAAA